MDVLFDDGNGGACTHSYPHADNWMAVMDFIQIVDKDGDELAIYAKCRVVAIRRVV